MSLVLRALYFSTNAGEAPHVTCFFAVPAHALVFISSDCLLHYFIFVMLNDLPSNFSCFEGFLGRYSSSCSRVMWVATEPSATAPAGVEIGYRRITVHGTSRDPATYPQPCIFCLLSLDGDERDEQPAEDGNPALSTSVFLVPSDPNTGKPLTCPTG